MDAAANSASVAIVISIGVSLVAGFFGVLVAMRSRNGAVVNRDTTVSILFGVALSLILANVIAAALIAMWGMEYVGVLKVALSLTAAFAVVGMGFGLARGLRSGRAIRTH